MGALTSDAAMVNDSLSNRVCNSKSRRIDSLSLRIESALCRYGTYSAVGIGAKLGFVYHLSFDDKFDGEILAVLITDTYKDTIWRDHCYSDPASCDVGCDIGHNTKRDTRHEIAQNTGCDAKRHI